MTPDFAGESPLFADLGLRPELLRALSTLGYEEPTPIQREAIPPLLAGHDLLGQAATGTGKTAAFALPILHRMDRTTGTGVDDRPRALVLVPTRELAMQVSRAVHSFGRDLGVRVLAIYGGQPIGRQLKALATGVDVVVATPGRALDHIRRGTLHLNQLDTVVLDEADEMLDLGFADDIEAILKQTPEQRQTVLFSATLPPRIDTIAGSHLNDPIRIEIGRPAPLAGEAPLVRQTAYLVPRMHKPAALGRVLDLESPAAALVFCRTREDVDKLTEAMNARGYHAEALHGGMSQEQRDRVMGRLRHGAANLLVATDVAARGLDIEQLSHVINYDVPSAPEAYVHRTGRVGRAGRNGVAITLTEPREQRTLRTIERVTGQRIAIEKIPSVADVRARRLERTRAALREVLLGDAGGTGLDGYQEVVADLAAEFDLARVAAAAVRFAHEATGTPVDEEEIPDVTPAPRRERRADRFGDRVRDFGERGRDFGERGREFGERAPAGRDRRRDREPFGRDHDAGLRGRGRDRPPTTGTTRLFVSVGRRAGVRPQDLVGAIAGESQLSGRDIGAIEIADRFSLVEVPESAASQVIAAMRGTMIKGKRATVRTERY